MYAVYRLGTAEEPLLDKSRVEEPIDYETRERSRLPEDLHSTFPDARWTQATHDGSKRRFPQVISHRGYKTVYPENTMKAFEAAVAAGTDAIETDIHLSKDDVVVLSHDRNLLRCFGRPEKILDCTWDFLSQQRTLRAPHQPMPRLVELLEYLRQPEQQHVWLFLDFKIDNDANNALRLVAQAIKSVAPGPRKWNQRIVLGIWAARYLPLCAQYLPGYPVCYIGFSTFLARQFLKIPNISFNMLQKVLLGPIGTCFIRDVKAANRQLYVWTVNEVNMMKWSIQKEVDGVMTDDPMLFREICKHWDDNEPPARPTWFQWLYTFILYILVFIFWLPMRRRFPETVDTYLRIRDRVLRVTSRNYR